MPTLTLTAVHAPGRVLFVPLPLLHTYSSQAYPGDPSAHPFSAFLKQMGESSSAIGSVRPHPHFVPQESLFLPETADRDKGSQASDTQKYSTIH